MVVTPSLRKLPIHLFESTVFSQQNSSRIEVFIVAGTNDWQTLKRPPKRSLTQARSQPSLRGGGSAEGV